MKSKLMLLAVAVAALGSCTTMYKTGQTPDDVYFSPARSYGEAVAETNQRPSSDDEYYNYTGDDRMIRMGINDSRWRYLNNDYSFSPYSYYNNYSAYNTHGYYGNYGSGYGGYYGSGYGGNYNPYYNDFYNNYYYNPYYSPYPVYITPASPIKNTTPRMTNLNGYSQRYNNGNARFTPVIPNSSPVRNYNNSNGRSALGNVLNNVLAPSNNNNNNNNYNTPNRTTAPERTYTPAPAPSSSSNSSSGNSSSGSRITRPN
jgi:hypothetical protein